MAAHVIVATMRDIVIFGAGDIAALASFYFSHDSGRKVAAFTVDAAYAAHMEEVTGSLAPGKFADFILIDRDYFEVPVSEIHQIQVIQTWVGGKQVYQRTDE